MEASGSHQIMGFGPDIMRLYDSHTGEVIVYAHRAAGIWHVHAGPSEADDTPGVDMPDRPAAIDAMVAQALTAIPETGLSVTCPWGLPETP